MAPTDIKFSLNPSGEIISYNYSIAYSPMKSLDILGQFIKSCANKRIQTGFYYTVVNNNWLNVERGFVGKCFLEQHQIISFIFRFRIEHYNQVK